MTNSFQAGDNGGGRPSRLSETVTGAPEKARYPSDPVYDRAAAPREEDALAATGGDLGTAARTATDAMKQQAARFVEDVGHELGKTGESQKARGVDALRKVADAIDAAADELKDQSPVVSRTVREAARQVDGLGDTLANRNVNDLVDQAVRFARSSPPSSSGERSSRALPSRGS